MIVKFFKKNRKKNSQLFINGFDEHSYLEANPDVKEAIEKGLFKSNLEHLEKFGLEEIREGKRRFHLSFEPFNETYYLNDFPDVKEAIEKGEFSLGFEHFCLYGYKEIINDIRNCHKTKVFETIVPKTMKQHKYISEYNYDERIILESGFFDKSYYLNSYPDVVSHGIEPIKHFCSHGWKELRNPNSQFNIKYYLEKYPDVKQVNINPLIHWIKYGQFENRLINYIEVDTNSKKVFSSPSIIFITHEASQTGAPAVLLSLMKWIKNNTDIKFSIIIGASGSWNARFEELAPCFYMDRQYNNFRKELRDFCGNNVQVVYINTIASGLFVEHLKFLNVEFITHVHEMENVFKIFETHFEAIKATSRKYIVVSQGSIEALKKRVNNEDVEITFLKPFIDPKKSRETPLSRPTNKRIIFGCGAVETRKGFDLFCDVAQRLVSTGFDNFKMYWIGSVDNTDLDPITEIEKRDINEYVEWIGPKEYPRDYFEYGDLFLLTSREDPYPLVCLEAAECDLPIICFDKKVGGMYTFVEDDAGIIVPYLDIDSMSNAIIKLLNDDNKRIKLGKRAHKKVKERHYVDVIAPKILDVLPKVENSNATSEFESYKEIINKYKIISFDIFDTLITREVNDPNVVFDIVEYEHTQSESAVIPLFRERMQTAGKVLQSYNGKKDDVSIDEIYENMSFYKNSEIEKKIEIQMCIPHSLGIKLYNYAIKQNKMVFITSDMYLDRDTIEKMLKKCGISKWNRLFLSSEQGKKKDTGRLYELMFSFARKNGYDKKDILHIGDNWVGDVDKAKEASIDAIRFNPLNEQKYKLFKFTEKRKNQLSQIGRIWNSFCIQSTNIWSEKNFLLSNDFYIKLGFELTGPLASMMAIHVKLLAEQTDTKKIVFMARDGRIIKKAFDIIYKNEIKNKKFESLYMNLSRATVIPATFKRELTANDIYFLTEGLHLNQKELKYFLKKSNIDLKNKTVINTVKKYFKSLDIIPTWNDLNKLAKMFRELSKIIYEANEKNRLALKLYLEEFGLMDEQNVILVDVGWLLNIQSRIDGFVKNYSQTKIIGAYIGSRDSINKSISHSSLLFDSGDPFVYSKFFEDNTTLCEVLFSAPEAPAKALTIDNHQNVKVEFKKLSMSLDSEFKIAQKIHMGAEEFFKYFAEARKDFFPEQISKDYFFYIFEALVNTDLDIAKATLGNFEVQLGGHHEFVTYEALIRNNTNFEYRIKSIDEYFEPIFFKVENPISKKIIITSAGLDNGSTRYRALNLAKIFQKQNIQSIVMHSATSIDKFQRLLENTSEIIFQRCFDTQGNVKTFYEFAKEAGMKTIFEIDDLVFPKFVENIGSVKGDEWDIDEAKYVANAYEKFLLKCDSVIVSTPLLREYVESEYNKTSLLIRNKITSKELIKPKIKKDLSLRIVYASGTYSHKKDFKIIEKVLINFMKKHKGKVSLSLLGAIQVSEELLSLENVSNYPLLKYNVMLQFISQHDLMLVPLEDDIFNRAKSNIKFVECGAVGTAVLASKVGEFDFAIEHMKNGLLASTSNEWQELLEFIVDNEEILKRLKYKVHKEVCENYMIL